MNILSHNERKLLGFICELNDSLKYLKRAMIEENPRIESNFSFEKAVDKLDRVDANIKKFLTVE